MVGHHELIGPGAPIATLFRLLCHGLSTLVSFKCKRIFILTIGTMVARFDKLPFVPIDLGEMGVSRYYGEDSRAVKPIGERQRFAKDSAPPITNASSSPAATARRNA